MKTRSNSVLSLCLHSLVIVLLGWGCYLLVKYATPEPSAEQPESGPSEIDPRVT